MKATEQIVDKRKELGIMVDGSKILVLVGLEGSSIILGSRRVASVALEICGAQGINTANRRPSHSQLVEPCHQESCQCQQDLSALKVLEQQSNQLIWRDE